MAESKTYLNVPYAQKDAAKALGARWDAANKKWYVPTGKDIELFSQWHIDSAALTVATTTKSKTAANNSSATGTTAGVFTHPTINDFVAYNGDEAPWD